MSRLPSSYAELLNDLSGTGSLYEDPEFPANGESIFPSKKYSSYEWKRPSEICSDPVLFDDSISRFDVKQGELGDCWVLASVASLCQYPKLLHKVVPTDQDFNDNYIGAFKFNFWQFDRWQEVIIDDKLPTRNGRLSFMQSQNKNEFWSALLEKAYAKLNGNYEALTGGTQAEAMVDFTGGLCETYSLNSETLPDDFFEQMKRNVEKWSLMGCSIDGGPDNTETEVGNGLLAGHAYSVTDVKEVDDNRLIRVRNPWGSEHEWTGAWSDKSDEWNSITESDREQLGLTFSDDGEFWMAYDDFINDFTKLEVCHLGPEAFEHMKVKAHWQTVSEQGSWLKNVNAGGCRNFLQSFSQNPQYRVEVVDPDDDDDDQSGMVLIGLQQKDMRKKKLDFLTVGYVIYKLDDPNCERLQTDYFKRHRSVAKSDFSNAREISGQHKLNPGHYVIVPSTFRPHEEANFSLRIFCAQKPNTSELDVSNSSTGISEEILANFKLSVEELETETEKLSKPFWEYAGPKEEINSHQLMKIINATMESEIPNFEGFDIEACRSMLALLDKNESGRMEFSEFMELWRLLRMWKIIFEENDSDKSGYFDAQELRGALRSAGFTISNRLFRAIVNRYACPETGHVGFMEFIMCLVRLKNAFKHYSNQVKKHGCSDSVRFTEDLYFVTSMYM